jgi:hypothetical protein
MSNNLPQRDALVALDAYSQILVEVLLTHIRNNGGYLNLDRFQLSELRRAGVSASDLKKSINLASKLELVTHSVRSDGTPVIKLVKLAERSVSCEQ